MDTLANVTLSQLASTPTSHDNKLLLLEISHNLTMEIATEARKLFQIKAAHGESMLLRLLAFVLRAFVDSVRVPDKLDAAELIELAATLAEEYDHDSLKDIILALKQARTKGTVFYNKLDQGDIYRVIAAYFVRKIEWREHNQKDYKIQEASGGNNILSHLSEKLSQQLRLVIDPAHPNAARLRENLSLTRQKEKRGIISPDQARAQRDIISKALERKPRLDWKKPEQ